MTNVVGRINKLEKEFIPKVKGEIIPILANAWKVGDKVYYFDLKGQEQEFKQSEHKETPIFNFVASKEEAYREIEEWEKQEDKSLEAFINWRDKKRREELAKPATP